MRVDALAAQALVEDHGDRARVVVEDAEGRDGASREAELLLQLLLAGEGEAAAGDAAGEGLEVDLLVLVCRDDVEVALLVVAQEEVLGVGAEVGHAGGVALGHREDGLVVEGLVRDASLVEEVIEFLLGHVSVPSPVAAEAAALLGCAMRVMRVVRVG